MRYIICLRKLFLGIVITISLLLSSIQNVNSQCANHTFVANDTTVCVPQVVDFSVLNAPAGTQFEWNFGSGFQVGGSSISQLYTNPGNYTISIKFKYLDNTTCIVTKTNYIKAKGQANVSLAVDKPLLCGGADTITLTDITPGSVKRDLLVDGVLYTNAPKSIKHYISGESGVKSAFLFTTDSLGCVTNKVFDTATRLYDSLFFDFISNPTGGCSPLGVAYTPLIIDSAEQTDFKFSWNLNGATPATSLLQKPSVSYNTAGSYKSALTITSAEGCAYSREVEDFINVSNSFVPNVIVSKAAFCSGEKVDFTFINASSSNIQWNFSPSDVEVEKIAFNSIRVKFRKTGNFSLQVIHTEGNCVTQRIFNNIVAVTGPVAIFKAINPSRCSTPDSIRLRNLSITNGVSTSYQWTVTNHENNSVVKSSSLDSLMVTFNSFGYYQVKLRTVGTNGCIDSTVLDSAISINPPFPKFTFVNTPSCEGISVRFTNNTPVISSLSSNKYEWTFFKNNTPVILAKSTITSPSLVYNDTGRHTVKLLAYNTLGCRDSVLYVDSVWVAKATASFIITDTLPCKNTTVKIKAVIPQSFSSYGKRIVVRSLTNSTVNYATNSINVDSLNVKFVVPGIYKVGLVYSMPGFGACKDTAWHTTRIKVSGAVFEIIPDEIEGCEPLLVTLTGQLKSNYNFLNSNTNYSYSWRTQPTTGVVFSNKNASITQATFTKKGTYRVWFSYISPSGCKDSLFYNSINSGVKSSFTVGTYTCLNKAKQLVNRSSAKAVQYKWLADSTHIVKFLPNDTAKNPLILFSKLGNYRVGLIAYGASGCSDTFYTITRIIDAKAGFFTEDSVNYCAPSVVTFNATKQYVSEFNWDFGDGKTVKTKNNVYNHIYTINSGPVGFDVRLRVKTVGCLDTLLRENYVKIIGPVAKYSVSNTIGCEPLAVKFKNESQYYKRFYLDFGDGTILDSSDFDSHDYKIVDISKEFQVFKTTLVLVDTFGCFFQSSSPDSIIVRKSPTANYTTNSDSACGGLKVTFNNKTIYAQDFQWDFEGDGIIDATDPSTSKSFSEGIYKPVLIATAGNGCSDTLKDFKTLKVFKKPEVDFTTASDSICFNTPLQFYGDFNTDVPVKKWLWDFGDYTSAYDTASIQNPSYAFKIQFFNLVSLIATNQNNCSDTVLKFVYVFDSMPPPNAGLKYVTCMNDQVLKIEWPKSQDAKFLTYKVYLDDGGFTEIYSTNNINDTSFVYFNNLNLRNRRYCVVIRAIDSCGKISSYSTPHCNIFLWVAPHSGTSNTVNWVHYEGWDSRWWYIVYRSTDNVNFIPIDTVSGNVSQYIDKGLCDKMYYYYVEAMHPNFKWRTKSNFAENRPNYQLPTLSPTILRTTVVDNAHTLTQWSVPFAKEELSKFRIERVASGGGSGNLNYATTQDTFFRDFNARVDLYSYTYRIRAEDNCGNLTPFSLPHSTVFLSVNTINFKSQLSWTPYTGWNNKIKHYVILKKFVSDTDFDTLAVVAPSVTNYEHSDIDISVSDSLCYAIIAVKDTSIYLESTSNIACTVSESIVWVPTAFSPNNDGRNDVFKASAVFVFNNTGEPLYDYKMEIFNRWGEKVFESIDVNQGWDGTVNGVDAPIGQYVFMVRAVGLDGKFHMVKGTLTLLR